MPGLFGGIRCKQEYYEELKERFEAIWGECDTFLTSKFSLGGHTHTDISSLYRNKEGMYFVVDGESSIYKSASQFVLNGETPIFELRDERFQPTVHCKGNVAIFDQNNDSLYLLTDWTGTFPLYYVKVEHGLLFSSLIKPLAKIIEANPDPIGIIQFMKYAYILNGRTHFKEISALLPGQALLYEARRNRLILYETSRAWTGQLEEEEFSSIVDRIWNEMRRAVTRSLQFDQKNALMTSAGWDSRLLLSCMRENIDRLKLLGYAHGDIQSRELILTSKIFRKSNIKYHLEAFNNSLYDLKFLQQGFERTENVIFPIWHRAGVLLAEEGVHTVSAGIFGEVLGGHYGKGMMLSDWEKMKYVASHFLFRHRKQVSTYEQDFNSVYNFLRIDDFNKPWYIKDDYWISVTKIKENINADIESSLRRLELRGITNVDQLIEAYITESRASHYIAAQLLICRGYLNIANIFGDQELFFLSSLIPLNIKSYNFLNQALLRKYAPDLLCFPTAASFATAGSPIVIQEMTRLLRKTLNTLSWEIYYSTHGFIGPKWGGWDNFEFLRDGKMLNILLENIRNDFVDKKTIEEFLHKLIKYKSHVFFHNVSNQLMKIYTTELMLR